MTDRNQVIVTKQVATVEVVAGPTITIQKTENVVTETGPTTLLIQQTVNTVEVQASDIVVVEEPLVEVVQTGIAGPQGPPGSGGSGTGVHHDLIEPGMATGNDHPQYMTDAEHDAVAGDHVTGGDTHDHQGGDGAPVPYAALSGLPDLTVYVTQAAHGGVTPQGHHDPVTAGDGVQIIGQQVLHVVTNSDLHPIYEKTANRNAFGGYGPFAGEGYVYAGIATGGITVPP